MNEFIFGTQEITINQQKLRVPQYEAYGRIREYYENSQTEREVGIILPVGCGKSGLITLTPFAVKSKRALVVAPNVKISGQLAADFDMSNPKVFYLKCGALSETDDFPESVEIRGTSVNMTDLENADVVITNIQQLQGNENRWLSALDNNFFDLIIFDEAHHNVANSWTELRNKFSNAKIINLSATPIRSDGQIMAGDVIYSYPVCDAIKNGYVKKLKAVVLNPASLRFVREDQGTEVEVPLDEVRRLGEEDADFRRSIITSKETANTIVDASIRELQKIRQKSGNNKHKIIASALNFKHCIQIKEAYIARGLRADYIHSKEDGKHNDKVLEKLENNELDVIVQVKKLGEGFDHPYLSVAAIFSVFNNLSPFIQFVGRIMRVVDQNSPDSFNNKGTVVFHAGANVAKRWEDFQQYSQADQEYFDQLLPLEELDFSDASELEIEPESGRSPHINYVRITKQDNVLLQEIPLLEDEEVKRACDILMQRGMSPAQYREIYEKLNPIKIPKVRQRQADRKALDELVKNMTGEILYSHNISPEGRELDKSYMKTNFVLVKSAIDKKISALTGVETGKRNEMTQEQINLAKIKLPEIRNEIERECFNG